MTEHMVQEVVRVVALALQTSLHIGDRRDDRVDGPRLDLRAQLLNGQPWCSGH